MCAHAAFWSDLLISCAVLGRAGSENGGLLIMFLDIVLKHDARRVSKNETRKHIIFL